MPHCGASDLVMHCLLMSHKKESRLIWINPFYFILSSEINAYKMSTKLVFSTVKRLCIKSLVSDTIYIFTMQQKKKRFDNSGTRTFSKILCEGYLSEIMLRML